MPGLLQTEDYARAIMLLRHVHASPGEIDRRVALRMARQAFLSQPGAPYLWVAPDEAALRRTLGDQEVQRAQLLHLIEMAQRPNITLQIVPSTPVVTPRQVARLPSYGSPSQTYPTLSISNTSPSRRCAG